MRPALRLLCALTVAAVTLHAQPGQESRRQTLDELLSMLQPSRAPANGRINAHDRTWEDWIRRTGELPPDFDALPSVPELPDPLVLREAGRTIPVTTPAIWTRQRAALRAGVEHWIFGRMPPAPDNLQATVTATHREGGATVREVRLAFGPDRRATLRIELVIPDGKGPFPVFLTNHARNRPWIYTAVRRGYIAAIYHATDPELRQRRRLGRVDRDLSRLRLVVPGAVGVGRVAHGRLPGDAARSGRREDRAGGALAQREAGAAGRGVRRAHRRRHPVERQQRRAGPVALHHRAVRQREHRAAGGRAVALVSSASAVLRRPRGQAAGGSEFADGARRAARADDVFRVRRVGGESAGVRTGVSVGPARLQVPRTRAEHLASPARGGTRDHRGRRRELHRLLRRRIRTPCAAEGRDVDPRLLVRRVAEAVGRAHRPRLIPGEPLPSRETPRRRGASGSSGRSARRRPGRPGWCRASCRRQAPATAGSRACSSVRERTPTPAPAS